MGFYAVSAIFQPNNSGLMYRKEYKNETRNSLSYIDERFSYGLIYNGLCAFTSDNISIIMNFRISRNEC